MLALNQETGRQMLRSQHADANVIIRNQESGGSGKLSPTC